MLRMRLRWRSGTAKAFDSKARRLVGGALQLTLALFTTSAPPQSSS
jgi:hypothetical protein